MNKKGKWPVKASRGFTLVEVLAVTVLITMLLGALYAMVNEGLRHWYQTSEKTELRNGANLVMHAIQKDLLKAKRSADGQHAVAVAADGQKLEIVTEWKSDQTEELAEPASVIIYTISKDPDSGLTKIWRYVGVPTSDPTGMALVVGEIDFKNSRFEIQGSGLVEVQLSLEGPRKNRFEMAASFRYLYGS